MELHLADVRLGRKNVFIITDHVEPGDRRGALGDDVDCGAIPGGESVAHEVTARAHVEHDVIGRGVAVALLESVDERLARGVLGVHDGVAPVGAHVVAARLESEFVALLERVPDETLRLPPADVRLFRGRPRRAEVFIIMAVPLVNLDDRLDVGVVVAPVGSHVGGGGVRGTDAAEVLEVVVKHFRVGRPCLVCAVHIAAR